MSARRPSASQLKAISDEYKEKNAPPLKDLLQTIARAVDTGTGDVIIPATSCAEIYDIALRVKTSTNEFYRRLSYTAKRGRPSGTSLDWRARSIEYYDQRAKGASAAQARNTVLRPRRDGSNFEHGERGHCDIKTFARMMRANRELALNTLELLSLEPEETAAVRQRSADQQRSKSKRSRKSAAQPIGSQ
jgi:hypothetical protein